MAGRKQIFSLRFGMTTTLIGDEPLRLTWCTGALLGRCTEASTLRSAMRRDIL